MSGSWRVPLLRFIRKLSWAADKPKRKQGKILLWQTEPKTAEIQRINMGQGGGLFIADWHSVV